jgi:hypothetical protein
VHPERSQSRVGQFAEKPEREVAVLLARCGELPLDGVEVAQEAIVSMNLGVQVGQ